MENETLKTRLFRRSKQILVIVFIAPWSVFATLVLVTCSPMKTREPLPKPELELAEVERPKLEKPELNCPVGMSEVAVSALSESGEITNTSVTCTFERIVRPLYRR